MTNTSENGHNWNRGPDGTIDWTHPIGVIEDIITAASAAGLPTDQLKQIEVIYDTWLDENFPEGC